MKPIAIIAIIAAVVVVGGACAGVAFSGVLNGGTTGPGGDDLVVPTDPVDPTPTETPTETPTPTPTDSSMSYFSPMMSSGSSSSGSSSSGGSNTPVCEHTEWEYKDADTTDGKHEKVCKACSAVIGVENCDFTGTPEPLLDDSHQWTCTICNLGLKQEVCEPNTETYFNNVEEMQHYYKCKICSDAMAAEACEFKEDLKSEGGSYEKISDTDSKHKKYCIDCGYAYEEPCTGTTIQPVEGELKHTGACDHCGANFGDGVACASDYYEPVEGESGKHIQTCPSCGRDADENGTPYTAVACSNFGYTANEDGKHKKYCNDCGQTLREADDCVYGASSSNAETQKHSRTCTLCLYTLTEDCTYVEEAEMSDEEGKHTYACTEVTCTNVKTQECKETATYTHNDGNTHTLTCEKCARVLQDNTECFAVYTDSPADAPTTRICECGCEADLVASIEKGSDIAYYISVKDAINDAFASTEPSITVKIIADGTYTSPTSVNDPINKELTIEGSKDKEIILDYSAQQGVNGEKDMTGTTLTFDNVTVKWSDANEGYQGIKNPAKVVYKNCTIEGTQFMYSGADFIGCTFITGDSYAVYTRASGDYTFTDCTFETGGRAIMMYNDAAIEVTVTLTRCTFSDDGTYTSKDKAAVETGDNPNAPANTSVFNIYLNQCTITEGFEENNSTSDLWGNKNNMPTDRLNVVIDDVDVY